MSTLTFKESLKYGSRLFALWFLVTLVGSGMAILGGYLAVPELQSLIASGTSAVETAALAGGLILAVLGLSSLIIGNFALGYKFLADSVAKGISVTSTQTLDSGVAVSPGSGEGTAEESAEQPEPSAEADQTAAESGSAPAASAAEGDQPPAADTQEPSAAASEEPVQGPAAVPASEQPTAETVKQPATHEGGQPTPAQSEAGATASTATGTADAEPAESSAAGSPATEEAATSQEGTSSETRERTAEEIAFGADGSAGPAEAPEETEETTATADDEWFDDESTADADTGAEMFEEEPAEEVDRRNMETANDSSADPLSDQFEE